MLINSCYDDWVQPTLTITTNDLDNIRSAFTADETTLNIRSYKSKKSEKKVLPGVKQIYFNEKAGTTAVVWDDGSEATVVRCGEGETFEPYSGFAVAVAKKLFGSTSAVKKLIDEKDADKAKARREEERKRKAEEKRKIEEKNRERREKKEEAKMKKAFEYIDKLMPQPDLSDLIRGMFGDTEETDAAEG